MKNATKNITIIAEDIGDLTLYVPTEIFIKHGIYPKFRTNLTDAISIDFNEQLVEESDVFQEEEE